MNTNSGPNPDSTGIFNVSVGQRVAVLIDGNNIERSIMGIFKNEATMVKFDTLIPRLLGGRELNRLVYFREGENISSKLAERLHDQFRGSVQPCHKSADIPLTIKATQLAPKVDTIIIMSGDSDYVELVRHLKSSGVRVEIASVEQTTAQILRDEADYFYPIQEDDCFGFAQQRNSSRPISRTQQLNAEASRTTVNKNNLQSQAPRPQNAPAGQRKAPQGAGAQQPTSHPTEASKNRRPVRGRGR